MESLPSMRIPSPFPRSELPAALSGVTPYWRLRAHRRLCRFRQGRCSLERWRRAMIILTLGWCHDARKGSIVWHMDEMGPVSLFRPHFTNVPTVLSLVLYEGTKQMWRLVRMAWGTFARASPEAPVIPLAPGWTRASSSRLRKHLS